MTTFSSIPPVDDSRDDEPRAALIIGPEEDDPTGKAEFGHIYNHTDAGPYYRDLGEYGYRIPEYGAAVTEQMLQARSGDDAGRSTVLDVCCSYGVGGALLTTNLDLDDLYSHYREAGEQGLSGEALARADRELLARHRLPGAVRVVGLDAAENAVNFGVSTGAMDCGVIADLEVAAPEPALGKTIGDVDVVMSTGGVGYITERTFDRLLGVLHGRPWFAVFCLRTFDYDPIAAVFGEHGLRTERVEQAFPQRRFVDESEQNWAIAEVIAQDLDPVGLEKEGMYFAELYVSRPPEDIEQFPLHELIPARLGVNR